MCVHTCICVYIDACVCVCVYTWVFMSIYLSIYLSMYLSIDLSICLSNKLLFYPSIYVGRGACRGLCQVFECGVFMRALRHHFVSVLRDGE
jgi:hypothetical protein